MASSTTDRPVQKPGFFPTTVTELSTQPNLPNVYVFARVASELYTTDSDQNGYRMCALEDIDLGTGLEINKSARAVVKFALLAGVLKDISPEEEKQKRFLERHTRNLLRQLKPGVVVRIRATPVFQKEHEAEFKELKTPTACILKAIPATNLDIVTDPEQGLMEFKGALLARLFHEKKFSKEQVAAVVKGVAAVTYPPLPANWRLMNVEQKIKLAVEACWGQLPNKDNTPGFTAKDVVGFASAAWNATDLTEAAIQEWLAGPGLSEDIVQEESEGHFSWK